MRYRAYKGDEKGDGRQEVVRSSWWGPSVQALHVRAVSCGYRISTGLSERFDVDRRGPHLGTPFIRSSQATSSPLLLSFCPLTSSPSSTLGLLYYCGVLGSFQESSRVKGWVYLNTQQTGRLKKGSHQSACRTSDRCSFFFTGRPNSNMESSQGGFCA